MPIPSRLSTPLVAALLILAATSAGQAHCYRFDEGPVTLHGVLSSKQVYGPPGYGADPVHDEKQTVLLLTLKEPICIRGEIEDALNGTAADDIRVLEVTHGSAHPLDRRWLGHPVEATGNLFRARAGEHQTEIMLDLLDTRAPQANRP